MAMPIGTITNYCFGTRSNEGASEKWLMCDGSAGTRGIVTLSDQEMLNTVIGNMFGYGTDGRSGNFTLPDLRGLFVRACDKSPAMGEKGADRDVTGRTAMATGGNTATSLSTVGTLQGHAIGPHTHGLMAMVGGTGSQYDPLYIPAPAHCYASSGDTDASLGTSAAGGSETRPMNIAFPFMILANNPQQRGPLGAIVAYAGADDPGEAEDGDLWLICDGREIPNKDVPVERVGSFIDQFKHLLAPVDGKPGVYTLPDLRSSFLRGFDKGGKNSGPLATIVDAAISAHSHPMHFGAGQYPMMQGNDQYLGGSWISAITPTSPVPTLDQGPGIGKETRPANANLHFIIRVT